MPSSPLPQTSANFKYYIVCINVVFFRVNSAIQPAACILQWGRQLSQYSDWPRAGRSGDRMPVGRDIPHLFRPVLGPTQPPVQWVPVFPGNKERPGRDADPSPPSSAVVMKEQSYTSAPPMGGRTACTEPQYLYKGALYRFFIGYLCFYCRFMKPGPQDTAKCGSSFGFTPSNIRFLMLGEVQLRSSFVWDIVRLMLIIFNLLKTKRRLFYLKTQFVPHSKHFSSWL